MSGLKSKLYDICSQVASEFPDWDFSSGEFKNKSLKHSTLAINPGFSFALNNTPLQPAVVIYHKRSMALFKELNGYELPTSIVRFQNVPQLLQHMPADLRGLCWILADKNLQMNLAAPSEESKKRMIDVAESLPILRAMMVDGIALIEGLYRLDSERGLLGNLPPKYIPGCDKVPYDEFERSKGVMVCIAHALIGDFDFAQKYREDNYSTIFPKKIREIDRLLEVMPQLKIQYGKASNVT